jgi:hypothetical protein
VVIPHDTDDNTQSEAQEKTGLRPEKCAENDRNGFAERHSVLHEKGYRVEIAEQEITSQHPENDFGCGTESFALKNTPEKTDDLLKHDGAVLRVLIEGNRGTTVPAVPRYYHALTRNTTIDDPD